MGGIAEFPGPFPGYTGTRPRSCTALPRILKENGYITGGFGKWHMTPGREMGPAGPFEHWPQAWGFDHWWGFLTGAAGQYDPIITQDNSVLGVPRGRGREALLLPRRHHRQVGRVAARRPRPRRRTSPGSCTTRPARRTRRTTSPRSGPTSTRASSTTAGTPTASGPSSARRSSGSSRRTPSWPPRPEPYPAWDTLSDAEKKLYARQMEVFAGFSENADWNVGRLLDAVEEMGELDNTLVIYIWGDNGASHGGHHHRVVQRDDVLQRPRPRRRAAAGADREVRRPRGAGRLPHAPRTSRRPGRTPSNTPFQWGKQMASHLGGARDPMVIAWPGHIKGGGDLRTQFTHCIDVAPTILDLVGIPEPKVVDGIEQEPMDGTPFAYTFDDPDAARAAHGPVLRDVRQPRHLQGRLVGLRQAGQAAVGLLAGDPRPVRAGQRVRPRPGRVGALLPAGRLLPGPRHRGRPPREARRAQGAVLAGGRAQPRAAAARRHGRVLRHPAADAHDHPVRRSPATSRTSRPR